LCCAEPCKRADVTEGEVTLVDYVGDAIPRVEIEPSLCRFFRSCFEPSQSLPLPITHGRDRRRLSVNGGRLGPSPFRRPKEKALNPLNDCTACGAHFTSLELFDRHRVGRHDPDERRCLTVAEMKAKGWRVDGRGRWTDPARATRAQRRFAIAA
jgi:hypothetical protein